MPPSLLHLHTIPLVILILALQSPALPTTLLPSNFTATAIANPIIPHCYTPSSPETPGIQPTNTAACAEALRVLVHSPDFTKPFRFSRNPRTMSKQIPTGWQLGPKADCRIVINCVNDRDTAVFRYADVAQVARKIIDNCVDHPDPHGHVPMLQWGGIHGLDAADTFYVAVAKPRRESVLVGNGSVGGEWARVEVA